MVLTLAVPDRYSWVLLTTMGATWLTMWQSHLVSKARRAAKIKYPQVYAEKAEAQESKEAMKFNCAQRAHQNTLENLPQAIFSLLVTGLYYPEVATGLGVTWLAGRVVYTLGYVTGDPQKRLRGGFGFLAGLGLVGAATFTTGKLVLASL